MLRLLLSTFFVVGVVAPNPYEATCSYGTPADLEYYNDDSPPSYFRMTTNGCMYLLKYFFPKTLFLNFIISPYNIS